MYEYEYTVQVLRAVFRVYRKVGYYTYPSTLNKKVAIFKVSLAWLTQPLLYAVVKQQKIAISIEILTNDIRYE